jgi:uncharacterized membrane protein
MPTDEARQTIEVKAASEAVLSLLRDVESQPEWIPAILEAEVLEVYVDDELPASVRFKAAAPVGSDEYTVAYDHRDDGLSWTLVRGRLQTGQEGDFAVEPVGPDTTAVTYSLTIRHNLFLPSFVRSRVINGLVSDTLEGLRTRVEA